MKSIVTGWPSSLPSSQFVGPNGRRRKRSKNPPTITGLMKSGITNSTIRHAAAAERPQHREREQEAERELDGHADRRENAVTQSECDPDRVVPDRP